MKRRYNFKQILIIIGILLCVSSLVIIFGKYVTNSIKNFFLRSKEFYFYSDKLTEKNSTFQVENWSGVDDYVVTVNMNSRKNNIQVATYDIGYDIKYKCSENAICQLSKESGTIKKETNTDFFNLTITPNKQLQTGDKVTVEIEATPTTGYKKTIKGKFTLVVGQENLTYQITDSKENPYMELRITNTISYYIVDQAFDNYSVNQKIDIDDYLSLSDEQKNKCHSAIIKVEFNPQEILLDNTSESYQKAINMETTEINGKTYIKSITLAIEAISSEDIRFYKVDVSQNYTYPNSNNKSVVTVTSR